MEKILIGLVAPKRSGKDTAADYLCQKYHFKKYNFADPLKEGIGKMFGFSHDQLYGKDKEVTDPQGPPKGSRKVLRGGAWSYHAKLLRSSNRLYRTINSKYDSIGFRIVLNA